MNTLAVTEALMDTSTMVPEVAPDTSPVPEVGALPAMTPEKSKADPEDEIVSYFKSRVEVSKRKRDQRKAQWKKNIEIRIGRVTRDLDTGDSLEASSDDARNALNPDWALTKTKTANLYSQTPTVQGTHFNNAYQQAVPLFMRELNYEIGEKRTNMGVGMEEGLSDIVNAAGIGALFVGYAARFKDSDPVPVQDVSMMHPDMVQAGIQSGQIPTTTAPVRVDYKFYSDRISPGDLLTPKEFTGSDFDKGPWVGRDARSTWANLVVEFELNEDDKKRVEGNSDSSKNYSLAADEDMGDLGSLKEVTYTDIYYWRHLVDPEETNFACVWRLVWVRGLTKPVYHGPWKGQKIDPQSGKMIGAQTFPIRICTITYISDHSIPPSDTEAGRPQVLDMIKSRSQMFQNRERSRPIRWYDANRIDPEIATTLMRGTWQNMIPTNGAGDKIVGEVARASYPSENITFDQQAKSDLQETWQVGPNQMGTVAGGDTTKAEVETVQGNFATRIGQERARVTAWFLSAVDVLAGLMVLHSDFQMLTDQERQTMQQAWNFQHINHRLVLKIRPDSSIVLDTAQRIQRVEKYLNMMVKSGYVNPLPAVVEYTELMGFEPADCVKQPAPPAPPPLDTSFRFSGKDDLQSPAVVAMLSKAGQLPGPKDLEAAKQFLAEAQMPPQPPQPPPGPGGPPPGGPGPGGPPTNPPVPPTENPEWQLASKIAQRGRDIGGGG